MAQSRTPHHPSHLSPRTLTGAALTALILSSGLTAAPAHAVPSTSAPSTAAPSVAPTAASSAAPSAAASSAPGSSSSTSLSQPGGTFSSGEPSAEETSEPTSQRGSLSWGLRQSFVSYVGGHHRIDGGVTESNREYTFPLSEVQQEQNTVRLSGRGLVQFAQYCEDPQDTETCRLDFTLSQPRVVLNPSGESALYATVRTRNYHSGQIEGPHEVRMALLDLSAASQVAEDGQIRWSDIATTLTPEGAHVFSDFYEPGTPLAPLSLTYPGELIDVIPAPYTIGESWNSGRETSDLHRAVELDGRLVHLTKSAWGEGSTRLTVVDPATMRTLSEVELPGSSTMAAASDAKSGRLYFYSTESHAIESLTLDEAGAVQYEGVVAGGQVEGEHEVFALGYNPATGGLAALILDGEGPGTLQFIDTSGTAVRQPLPDPVSTSAKLQSLPNPDGLYVQEFYGSAFLKNARVLEPLPDGSFLYAPGSSVYDAEDQRVLTGHLLQFSPQGSDHADQPVREVSDRIFPEESIGVDMRGLSTHGGTVLRWNDSWGEYAAHQVLQYQDGEFTVTIPASRPADEASELSGMFVDDGGRIGLVDTTHGRVLWLGEDGQVAEELNVPHLSKSAKNNPTVLKLSTGDLVVPQMIEDENYNEILYLQKLVETEVPSIPAPTDPGPGEPVPSEPVPSPSPDQPSSSPSPDQPSPDQPSSSPSPNQPSPDQPSSSPSPDQPSPSDPGPAPEPTAAQTPPAPDGDPSPPPSGAGEGDVRDEDESETGVGDAGQETAQGTTLEAGSTADREETADDAGRPGGTSQARDTDGRTSGANQTGAGEAPGMQQKGSASQLAHTGRSVLPLLVMALAVTAAGGAAVLWARRRARS